MDESRVFPMTLRDGKLLFLLFSGRVDMLFMRLARSAWSFSFSNCSLTSSLTWVYSCTFEALLAALIRVSMWLTDAALTVAPPFWSENDCSPAMMTEARYRSGEFFRDIILLRSACRSSIDDALNLTKDSAELSLLRDLFTIGGALS